jgi:hypothetical protein
MLSRRARRHAFLFATIGTLASAIVGAAACSSEPSTKYGNPGALKKDNLPGEAGIEPLVCGADGGGDAGTGGGPDACAVSWKNDIWANMVNAKAWQCATGACHAPGNTQPAIDPMDSNAALTSLKGYKLMSKPTLNYIDTSGDPSKSSIECNLSGQCSPPMPTGAGRQLTSDERCKLHAWLLCGAPNN